MSSILLIASLVLGRVFDHHINPQAFHYPKNTTSSLPYQFPASRLRASNKDLPSNYDLRQQYPDSVSLKTVLEQGECQSSWAISSTGAYADSLYIHKKINIVASPQFQMNCDTDCAPDPYPNICQRDCKGGSAYLATAFLGNYGVVSQDCVPYRSVKGECADYCQDKAGKITETPFKIHSDLCSAVIEKVSVDLMKQAIYQYGSILTQMEIFEDIQGYKTGVYQHSSQKSLGYQAIRIVGWGTEGGKAFWLVHGCWGTGFGESGRIKILAGKNECSIEKGFYFFAPCEDFHY
ncbi:putative Cathepsin B [Blattamonas nauphoetae]|uniref:Cathepsin B n=1 Tax=Blattamonas nauphoetae TaxID=2049346 RepID=A0ABQ9Y050_9EUKA|nr:putative Cathepsin B [Blattamonas nauphoetae]